MENDLIPQNAAEASDGMLPATTCSISSVDGKPKKRAKAATEEERKQRLKEDSKRYRDRNREKINARGRKYRMENAEKEKARAAKYHAENKEKRNATIAYLIRFPGVPCSPSSGFVRAFLTVVG